MDDSRTETVILTFTAMAYGGAAVARAPNGRVVFVPYAIAGETARVEIVEAKKGFARGRMVELLDASPARVRPRCPHFGPYLPSPTASPEKSQVGCGGCQWQHIAYEAQLEFKTQIVREQFARIAKMPEAPIAPIIPAANPWHYRNHMRFIVDADGALGLQVLESHDLIRIRECHIMDDALVSLFEALELEDAGLQAVTLRAGERTGERLVILEAADAEPTRRRGVGTGQRPVPTMGNMRVGASPPTIETDEAVSIAFRVGTRTIPLIGHEALHEQVGALTFRISPGAFFQVNTVMAERLVSLVADWLAPRQNETLLDAYSGVGLFGLSLAPQVGRVILIEEDEQALEDARENARAFAHVEFHAGRVQEVLPRLEPPLDLAIVDPPRAGMTQKALAALAAHKPRAIAYVSCDPPTLARDARLLTMQGYRLVRVQPVDLFPQTYHIECVSLFDRI